MITPGMQAILDHLGPRGPEGQASFPRGFEASDARYGKQEKSIASWFRGYVDRYCDGEPQRCAFELDDAPKMALMGTVRWQNYTEIQHVNLQALVVQKGDLVDVYLDDSGQNIPVQYLRLDFDLNTLGLLLKEPQPHVHVHPTGELRLSMRGSGNAR